MKRQKKKILIALSKPYFILSKPKTVGDVCLRKAKTFEKTGGKAERNLEKKEEKKRKKKEKKEKRKNDKKISQNFSMFACESVLAIGRSAGNSKFSNGKFFSFLFFFFLLPFSSFFFKRA